VSASRKTALIAGVLFLISFITAIPALYLFQSVLDDPGGYIAGAGADNRVLLGAFLELLLIIANVGTAVVLFPILKRQSESLALGYVTARLVECIVIAVGLVSVLAVVTLRLVRRLRARWRGAGDCDNPGVSVGAIAWHLAHRQRIQAVSDPLGGCPPRPADVLIAGQLRYTASRAAAAHARLGGLGV
jgi:uncharacterized protein DUF4386